MNVIQYLNIWRSKRFLYWTVLVFRGGLNSKILISTCAQIKVYWVVFPILEIIFFPLVPWKTEDSLIRYLLPSDKLNTIHCQNNGQYLQSY